MHLFYRRADGLGERAAGLDDHHHFLAALDRALPPIVRDHTGKDVHARAQAPLDERTPGLLRLDNRGIGRIDEDRALHVFTTLPVAGAACRPSCFATEPRDHDESPMSAATDPASPSFKRIAFVASSIPEAQE